MDKRVLEAGKEVKQYIKDNQYSLLNHLFKDIIYEITYNNTEINASYLDVLKVFLANGMNVNMLDEDNNLVVFEDVLEKCFDLKYFDYLMGKNIDLNVINKNGDTILDKIEQLCMNAYDHINDPVMDFELTNEEKYEFYKNLILLLKAYDAKCSFEI